VQHLQKYNYHAEWNVPVAPEAYTRSLDLFGDQYSNFNAGKILLFLEGLAGLEYSLPEKRLTVRDTMPTDWSWMEFRLPMDVPAGKDSHSGKRYWPVIRFDRSTGDREMTKTIRVTDCPLAITIEPWSEGRQISSATCLPTGRSEPVQSTLPGYHGFHFKDGSEAQVELRLISP